MLVVIRDLETGDIYWKVLGLLGRRAKHFKPPGNPKFII